MTMPSELTAELTKMRRNPALFAIDKAVRCKFCGKGQTGLALLHAESLNAGTWCPEHGWLYFDSVKIPPTERLTASEVEDRKLASERSKAVARRKEQVSK
jgi:hypothetical protein